MLHFVFDPELYQDEGNESYADLPEIDQYFRGRLETDAYRRIFNDIMSACNMKIFHFARIDDEVHIWARKEDDTPVGKEDIADAIDTILVNWVDTWGEGDILAVPTEITQKYGENYLGIELYPNLIGLYLEEKIKLP